MKSSSEMTISSEPDIKAPCCGGLLKLEIVMFSKHSVLTKLVFYEFMFLGRAI